MLGWWRRRARSKAEAQRLLQRMTGEPGGRGDAHGRGGPGRTGDIGDSPLAGLLRAAAGPARPGELAGSIRKPRIFTCSSARPTKTRSPSPVHR
ncbi:hypothetical protein AB0J72_27185, partial [Dactylosporangium sp. NPDC049742]